MLSIYTKSHPYATSIQNMEFIIIWNVAGELVRLKNITVGSNSPSGVRKAAFHLSPSQIWMLLYPHHMSNFVNGVHPANWSITCGMSGDTLWFCLMYLLRGWSSWTGHSFPSFFFMKKKLVAYGPLPIQIVPHFKCS
jgi:hypothetical protein